MSTLNIIHTKEILNYKRFDTDDLVSDVEIPETAQNRQKTDKYFLFIFIGFVVLLIPFLAYTLYYSDIRRINGYDSCGNICGEKNVKYDQWNCTGKDMTYKPKFIDGTCERLTPKQKWKNDVFEDDFNTQRITVANYDEDLKTEEYIKNAYVYIEKVGWKIALSSFLSLGYCIVMVVLFRHATAVLVWGILILSWSSLGLLTMFLWRYAISDSADSGTVTWSIFLSCVDFILLLIMICLRKRIRLVIMLFKESSKAVFDMTLIFSVPVMTMLMTIIITIVCLVSTNYICTSGILMEITDGVLDYVPNTWMLVTLVFNVIMAYWAIQFIGGIQYMVISGAISKWYFTKNKALLGSPILTSALIAFKFHLGTVALGSLIVTLVTVLRATLKTLARHHRLKLLIDCCMNYLEAILKFFTKNSFIITAMHGTSFFQSGKQVVKLVELNICNTIVVNYIGDFVLAMAQILIICLSTLTTYILLLGEDTTDYWFFCYLIVLGFALICSYNILTTFQTAVDTMFLCFCEDCLINDGVNKPYAMPRGFMEFVESSKEVFAKKIQEKGLPTI